MSFAPPRPYDPDLKQVFTSATDEEMSLLIASSLASAWFFDRISCEPSNGRFDGSARWWCEDTVRGRAGHTLANLARGLEGPSWKDIVRGAAEDAGVESSGAATVQDLEAAVTIATLRKVAKKLNVSDPKQRSLREEIEMFLRQFDGGSTSFAGLGLALQVILRNQEFRLVFLGVLFRVILALGGDIVVGRAALGAVMGLTAPWLSWALGVLFVHDLCKPRSAPTLAAVLWVCLVRCRLSTGGAASAAAA